LKYQMESSIRSVLILLLLTFSVGCQATSKVEEEPKEAEKMTSLLGRYGSSRF